MGHDPVWIHVDGGSAAASSIHLFSGYVTASSQEAATFLLLLKPYREEKPQKRGFNSFQLRDPLLWLFVMKHLINSCKCCCFSHNAGTGKSSQHSLLHYSSSLHLCAGDLSCFHKACGPGLSESESESILSTSPFCYLLWVKPAEPRLELLLNSILHLL